MSIQQINNWFSKAVPEPQPQNFHTQLGVHLEEVAEMLKELDSPKTYMIEHLIEDLEIVSSRLKSGLLQVTLPEDNRSNFLKELCDQIVTATGVANFAKMEITPALQEVADSNDSKFVNGEPVFDANKKIQKGPSYWKPNLDKFVD